MLCLIYHKKQTGSFTICKVKKQVVTESILAYVKRSAEKKCRHTLSSLFGDIIREKAGRIKKRNFFLKNT